MSKILIVDDKESDLFALEKALRPLSVDIVRASSGDEALQVALNHEFALALVDVQMPVMDGYELAALLRSDCATGDLPIIFLSAVYSAESYVFRGYASGGVDFIIKPIHPEILLSKVRVFLALHDQKRELADHKARLEALVSQLEGRIKARREAEAYLRTTNECLEQKISARTADLSETVEALGSANAQLAARTHQLRALAGDLTMAERRERQRVSRILHDGLQQNLAVAKLQLNLISGRLGSHELKRTAGEITNLLGESIEMARSLSAELSPPMLFSNDLSAGLEWLAEWMREKHGLRVDLDIQCRPELPEDVKIFIFEAVRELLFNTVKHARVSAARVRLQQVNGSQMRICVRDEGTGFDPVQLEQTQHPGDGFGLLSIRERIALIGGCLQIATSPGAGSCFDLQVPLPPETTARDRFPGLDRRPIGEGQ